MKKPERSELEYLRGLVKELKSENRHLKRTLGRSEKKVKQYQEHVELVPEPEVDEAAFAPPAKLRCPECESKEFDVVDLVVKDLHLCPGCGYRKVFPKKKPS